jgi:hypothetical protein
VSWDARRLGVIASLQHNGLCVLEGAGTASCRGGGGGTRAQQSAVFFEIPARHASPRVMRIFHHKDHMEGELLCTYIVQSFQVIGIVPLFTQIVVRLWAWDMLKFRHRIKLFHW